MMVNKLSFITLVTVMLGSPAALADNDTHVSGGTITFTGTVTDTTCVINGGKHDFTVALPPITTHQVNAKEDIGVIDMSGKPFELDFSDCSVLANNTLKLRFSSPHGISPDGAYILNQSSHDEEGMAKNLSFSLTNPENAQIINMNEPYDIKLNRYASEESGGDQDKPYNGKVSLEAHYYKTVSEKVIPGKVKASLIYTLSYQ